MRKFIPSLALVGALLLQTGTVRAGEPQVFDAEDVDALREAAADKVEAVVEGVVQSIGSTPENTITFLNIGAPKREGFVAIIFQRDFQSFPEGFSHFNGQRVRVSGILELYRENQPQIRVNNPAQIEIIEQ